MDLSVVKSWNEQAGHLNHCLSVCDPSGEYFSSEARKLIANKKLAKSNREIAMLDFVNTLLTAYKEVENGFESDLTSNQALETINQNIILSESIYSTTLEGFMKGSSTFEDAINANNALYDNLDLKSRLEKVRIEQRINLILALGGGFKTND